MSGYHVSGAITRNGAAVPDVAVSVDDALNWTATTDRDGHFDISGVPAGAHTVGVWQSNADGSFNERRAALQVTGDVVLDPLVLPAPLVLGPPVAMGSEVTITWQATDAADFREYKLYRHDSPGIDENAGELIFVSTAGAETTFLDSGLLAGKTYYYRVYAMNQYGRLGGSNIVSSTIRVENLIPDGNFEATDALSRWSVSSGLSNGTVDRDATVAGEGVASLHVTNGASVKLIDPIAIQQDVAYDLTFFLKLHGSRRNIDDASIVIYQGSTIATVFPIDSVSAGSARDEDVDWMKVAPLIFSVTGQGAITVQINGYSDDLWIDDLVLRPHAVQP